MRNKLKSNVCIVLIILIIIAGIIMYFNAYSIEGFRSEPKIWAMSFGGGGKQFHDAVNRIADELLKTNFFDEIVTFKDIDLKNDPEFWEKHKNFIETNKRGYGYWLWKPYLIKKTFDQMQDEDVLFYLDAGCEIKNENIDRLNDFVKTCKDHELLYTLSGHDEKSHTKMDLFNEMKMNKAEILNSMENQATVIIIKKTDLMNNFLDEWYSIACKYHLLDDSPSIMKNDVSFEEHRHDQSIFSLLTKSNKYKDIVNNKKNILEDANPIMLSRKRSG